MKVLCTMPGKFGDILWSLPTVRAIAEAAGEPVDFMISAAYGTLAPLLAHQPYLRNWIVNANWQVRDTAPMTPSRPPDCPVDPPIDYAWDKTIHLGYERWPQSLLPTDIFLRATVQWGSPLPTLDLNAPWLEVPDRDHWSENETYTEFGAEHHPHVHVGWSEEHVELKAGLIYALSGRLPAHDIRVITHLGSRLATEWLSHYPGNEASEGFENLSWYSASWEMTAHALSNSKLFLGCLSAQWVLANALGIPTVIVEPNEARHNPIFFYDHPRNTMLMGNDGKPTFDARHLVDTIRSKLHG